MLARNSSYRVAPESETDNVGKVHALPAKAGQANPETLPQRSNKSPRKGLILALVCLAQFMVLLDISIVNVALPAMRHALRFDDQGLQWVVNAYTLTFAGFLLLGGRAADLYGQRKLFVAGVALFGLASIAGGLAQSQGVLIAARALQGFGGAVLSPATLTVLATTFTEPRERARAMGLWSAVAGAGGAAGALLGGFLTDVVGWRSIFLLNVPISMFAVVAGLRLLRLRNERHANELDVAGAVLVTGGLVAFVYGIVSSEQYGWSSWHSAGTLVVGAVLIATFIFHEVVVAKEPLMPVSLWKSRTLATANATMLLMAMGMFSMWYFVSLELQLARGYSPLRAGLAFLPMTVGIIAGAQLSSRTIHIFGARRLALLATLTSAAGSYWLSVSLGGTGVATSIIVPGTVITFGLGLAMTPVISSAMAGVDRRLAGLASGVINTSRQVGGSIGLAVLITIANHRTHHLQPVTDFAAAATSGYQRGLMIGAFFLLGAAIAASFLMPAPSTRRSEATSRNATQLAVE